MHLFSQDLDYEPEKYSQNRMKRITEKTYSLKDFIPEERRLSHSVRIIAKVCRRQNSS